MGRTEYAASPGAQVQGATESSVRRGETMPNVPKASTHLTGSSPKKANTKSPDAPAYICIFRVASEAVIYENDEGGCLFPGIKTCGNSVHMVTFSHWGAYPSVDFKMAERFDDFLRAKNSDETGLPKSWLEMLNALHAVSVVTGSFVPYNLPYTTWQRVVYVGGSVENVRNYVMELDNLIMHLMQQPAKPKLAPSL